MMQNPYHPAVRMSLRAASKSRRGKPLAAMLTGLVLIAAVAPARATPVDAGKTKSSMNLLEQLHELIVNCDEMKTLMKYAKARGSKAPSDMDGKYIVAPRHQMQTPDQYMR